MQISIQLDDEHAQKLAYIQQTTQENTLETIQQAIELCYQKLQEKTHDPLAKLKQSSFIGSFEAEANFAENSENILHSLLSEVGDIYSGSTG
jgi:predicted transcriptional regulator